MVATPVSIPVASNLAPPIALRRPRVFELHGERFEDDYYWLRDRDDPAVGAYLEAENAYADQVLAATRSLQESLYQEMLGRIKQTDVSVPYRDGGHWYYYRTEEGKQYPIYCRKRGSLEAPEEILLDLNAMAVGHPFMALGALAVSDDGRLLAYSTDVTGYREYTLVVRDLATGEQVAGPIEKCGSVAWAADNRTFFHAVEDEAKRFHQIWRHELGGARELVYEEADARFRVGVERTRSRRFLLLQSDSHTTSELRFLPAGAPRSPWRLLAGRVAERELEADDLGDGWLLRVNDTGPNFRVVRLGEDDFAPERWTELLPHRDAVMIEAVDSFADHWVAWEREAGLVKIRVTRRDEKAVRNVEFPEPGYESPVTPSSVYDYDVAAGTSTLLKRREVLGDFDPSRYGCERRSIPAPDGTPIPVSLVFRREPQVPAPAPMLLTGYGAYGISYPVGFSSNR